MTDNVAIYLPIEFPGFRLIRSALDVEFVASDARLETSDQCAIEVSGALITLNCMASSAIQAHLEGFANYALEQNKRRPTERIVELLEKLRAVKSVIGCAIEPGFDEKCLIATCLFNVAHKFNGLVFVRDSVFDSNGEPLLGPVLDDRQAVAQGE